ncbi:LacI family DNA-binding transcriptional regulator [Nonomuraea jiangxiensis]|uniref:DNA-binding transcriptional regulator, LacI/PurR family n=1 Tax=Nonomuraea jiangxiensis TaxID=633440 RepID=A0A1G8T755_9ACTN|nr:LacI family DNA-binding transcriptional regulator [Nonomuraea jiangxiensis]SDJ36510.1 DNA-binding transcriptional regulator, LacI/PurR family [Nonomuraea jiangxiensis]
MADKVTITDVARAAGVSRQTVSNTLNSPEVVRDETRRHVLEVIARLGYRANQAARQMRTGRSRLIAIRIDPGGDGINGSVLDRFLHGLTESAARAGYRILLYTAHDDRSEIATFEDLIASYEPDAFVLTATHHDDLRTSWLLERRVPFVAFGRPWSDLPRTQHPWVDVDGAAGTAAATRHLLAAGHRRVGFVGWPPGSGVGDDRRAGWERTLAEHGLRPDDLHRAGEDGIATGESAARDLLGAGATALVCASDSLALGALNVAGPGVAVTGFDDTPVAGAIGLTSVHQPLGEAAAACVALLTRALDSAEPPATHMLLQPSLTIRRSA